MPIVTSIKKQKKDNRVNVYLDYKFGFGIDLDNFVKCGLRVEQELSEEEIIKIIGKAEFQKTLDKLFMFASLRPRSEKEVTDWFRRKKISEAIHKDLVEKIKHYELLDDQKFAKWWVDQRNSFKPRSKKLLKLELSQKGIDREIIEEILGDTQIDEQEIAYNLVIKKKSLIEKLPDEKAKQKLVGFLARKGFSWDVIEEVLERVVK